MAGRTEQATEQRVRERTKDPPRKATADEEKLLRLASFPNLNPNPIIEIDPVGTITYLNPAAEKLFPDMQAAGSEHPILKGLQQVMVELQSGKQENVVREVEVGNTLYEQHISYVSDGNLMRVYSLNITERKRFGREIESRYQELQTLQEISQTILSSPDLQTIVEEILDKALLIGPFDLGVIRLLDRSGKTLIPVASRGYLDPENLHGKTTDPKDATAGMILLRVITDKGARVVEDVTHSDGLRSLKKEGAKSAIVVPVGAGEEVLGIIQLGSRTARKFQPSEVHLLEAIGSQMGIAVQKARLSEKTERRAREISALNTVTAAVSTSLDLDEILDKSLHAVLLFTGMEVGYIRFLEGNPPEFTLKVHKGISPAFVEKLQQKRTRPGGKAEEVLTTKRSVIFENVSTQHAGGIQSESLTPDVNTAAWIPIISREQVIGIINVATWGTQTFSPDQIGLLESIGASIGVALENARLFQEAERRRKHAESLREIGLSLTATHNLQQVLERIAEEARQLIGALFTFVVTPDTPFYRISAVAGEDQGYRDVLKLSDDPASPYGQGPLGRAIRNHTPVVCEDVLTDPLFLPWREISAERGIRSLVAVPLLVQEKPAGVLLTYAPIPRAYDDETMSLLSSLAAQAAVALENARLFEEVSRKSQQFEALVNINKDVAALLDLDILLPRIAEQAGRLLKMDGANFRLIEGENLELRSSLHTTDVNFRQRLRLGESLSGKVIQENRIVAIRNVVQDPTLIEEHRESLCKAGYHAYLGIPLRIGTRVVGAVNLLSRKERDFSSEEISLMSAFAAQAATAVQNAQLFEQTKKQAAELEKDIIKRKRAEEELKTLATKLEQSNRELQDFASVASHDLQEPLRKILAFGDRLKTKCSDALSDEGRNYLERMQNAAGRMQTLINDVLMFSRVTTKARPFVPVDLADVTREVLSDLEVRILQTGGSVELGSLPTIDADPTQMRQLLQNLIGNALKFHRQEVAPVIKIQGQFLNGQGRTSAGSSPAKELCQITVEDNGIGFDEKYLDRIFSVFQRLHGRSEYEGSGIGLAVCRKIVERHGGNITAISTRGQGSTFIVKLPVKKPKGGDSQWRKTENESRS
ncbi:MAG: GAF domain-containing protein [Deltaproteobacteria bacterium]|nr:GAF domain-containing protein [Deltaproteobacteria bacterium]